MRHNIPLSNCQSCECMDVQCQIFFKLRSTLLHNFSYGEIVKTYKIQFWLKNTTSIYDVWNITPALLRSKTKWRKEEKPSDQKIKIEILKTGLLRQTKRKYLRNVAPTPSNENFV